MIEGSLRFLDHSYAVESGELQPPGGGERVRVKMLTFTERDTGLPVEIMFSEKEGWPEFVKWVKENEGLVTATAADLKGLPAMSVPKEKIRLPG